MKNKKEEWILQYDENGPILRKHFRDNELGEYCYRLVLEKKIVCDTIVGPDGERCGKPAIGTTEYDLAGELMIKGHCSRAHHEAMKTAVNQELREQGQGRMTSFGINGWGRGAGVLFSHK